MHGERNIKLRSRNFKLLSILLCFGRYLISTNSIITLSVLRHVHQRLPKRVPHRKRSSASSFFLYLLPLRSSSSRLILLSRLPDPSIVPSTTLFQKAVNKNNVTKSFGLPSFHYRQDVRFSLTLSKYVISSFILVTGYE